MGTNWEAKYWYSEQKNSELSSKTWTLFSEAQESKEAQKAAERELKIVVRDLECANRAYEKLKASIETFTILGGKPYEVFIEGRASAEIRASKVTEEFGNLRLEEYDNSKAIVQDGKIACPLVTVAYFPAGHWTSYRKTD